MHAWILCVRRARAQYMRCSCLPFSALGGGHSGDPGWEARVLPPCVATPAGFFLCRGIGISVYRYIEVGVGNTLGRQTLRFTIVGRLSGGHRGNIWRIGMPKLSRVSNVMFYNSLALLVHQTVRFTIVGRPHATKRYVAL